MSCTMEFCDKLTSSKLPQPVQCLIQEIVLRETPAVSDTQSCGYSESIREICRNENDRLICQPKPQIYGNRDTAARRHARKRQPQSNELQTEMFLSLSRAAASSSANGGYLLHVTSACKSNCWMSCERGPMQSCTMRKSCTPPFSLPRRLTKNGLCRGKEGWTRAPKMMTILVSHHPLAHPLTWKDGRRRRLTRNK